MNPDTGIEVEGSRKGLDEGEVTCAERKWDDVRQENLVSEHENLVIVQLGPH